MVRKIKKNIALENRRKELDEELQSIRRELRRKRREAQNLPDPVAVLRRIWTGSEEMPESPRATAPGMTGQPPAVEQPVVANRAERPDTSLEGEGGGEVRSSGPIRRGDARFASYFVTGGLHGIKPLRHEKRILRNRAIAWIVLCLFIIITVYVIFF
jgi:hypothetical protein